MSDYDKLDYSQDELQSVMRAHYDKLIAFVTTEEFKQLFEELMALPPQARPAFVQDVVIDRDQLRARGIEVPEGILIQRSAFGDMRPTLFAVKHFLPDRYRNVWENVNLTFDNAYGDDTVSRDKEICWRPPLDPAEQALVLASQ